MAELTITARQATERPKVTVLDLVGSVTIGEGVVVFRKHIRRLLGESRKQFVINMAGLNGKKPVDSSGIGELCSAYTVIRKAKGRMVLLNIPESLRYSLEVTKLDSVFKVYNDEEKAVNSFRK